MGIKKWRCYVRFKHLYHQLREDIMYFCEKHKFKYKIKNKNIYIFLSADYGNLGDVAITLAQRNFIKDYFPEYNLIEIPLTNTYNVLKHIKNNIKENDIVTIIGGGNMTNRYEFFESRRRQICKRLKNNLIISFPQTIDYTNDTEGHYAEKESFNTYTKIKKYLFTAREQSSYELLQKHMPKENVMLMPDIVFYLNGQLKQSSNTKKINTIGLCLRNDIEKNSNNKVIINKIKKIFKDKNIETFDTHIGNEQITLENRETKLYEFTNNLSKYEFVITDRLHCMIFCCLMNIPCIVLDNSNHKIMNVYNTWIKNNFKVKLITNINDINNIKDFPRNEPIKHKTFFNEYNNLYLKIKNMINK